ncbi:unnamed protein product [Pleuronectes platessa]|uniref:Uncharacterized protein n=1 Tax=Pleuronectes platessa TaxID=8262 RepID=A0A9N7Z982_PLEPL|nr:unnamed protein product [Pleuronectes platessa]
MDLKWGGARQRGGRRREGGEMDGAQPRVEPSAADSPPLLFWKLKTPTQSHGARLALGGDEPLAAAAAHCSDVWLSGTERPPRPQVSAVSAGAAAAWRRGHDHPAPGLNNADLPVSAV